MGNEQRAARPGRAAFVRRWIVATAAGLVVGGVAAAVPALPLALAALATGAVVPAVYQRAASGVSVLLVGAVVGLGQRRVLRAAGWDARWWVLVAAVSWPLVLAVPGLVARALPPPTDDGAGALYGAARVALAWAAGGGAFGACQGWAVTRDRGQTRRWGVWGAGAALAAGAVATAPLLAYAPTTSPWNAVAGLARTLVEGIALGAATGALLARRSPAAGPRLIRSWSGGPASEHRHAAERPTEEHSTAPNAD